MLFNFLSVSVSQAENIYQRMAINHGALLLPPPSVLLNNEPKSPVLLCTGSDQRIYSLPVRDIDILAEFQVFDDEAFFKKVCVTVSKRRQYSGRVSGIIIEVFFKKVCVTVSKRRRYSGRVSGIIIEIPVSKNLLI